MPGYYIFAAISRFQPCARLYKTELLFFEKRLTFSKILNSRKVFVHHFSLWPLEGILLLKITDTGSGVDSVPFAKKTLSSHRKRVQVSRLTPTIVTPHLVILGKNYMVRHNDDSKICAVAKEFWSKLGACLCVSYEFIEKSKLCFLKDALVRKSTKSLLFCFTGQRLLLHFCIILK